MSSTAMKRGTMSWILGLAALLLTSGIASAQDATIGADLGLNSRYMFWGLTLSNKPVWQPDVYLTTHGFTFGVWGNFEFERQSANSRSDYTSGGDRSGNTEIDYWVEYAHSLGNVSSKFGVIQWTYDRSNTGSLAPYATQANFPGLQNGPDIDSTEIYAGFTWGEAPFSPNLQLFYDVDIYRGLFGMVSVTKPFEMASNTVNTTLLVGFSTGHSNLGSREIPLYAKEGLTHVDLSASLPLSWGATSITPNLHLQYNIDDVVKITGFDSQTGAFTTDNWVVTFGVTFAWSKGLGGK